MFGESETEETPQKSNKEVLEDFASMQQTTDSNDRPSEKGASFREVLGNDGVRCVPTEDHDGEPLVEQQLAEGSGDASASCNEARARIPRPIKQVRRPATKVYSTSRHHVILQSEEVEVEIAVPHNNHHGLPRWTYEELEQLKMNDLRQLCRDFDIRRVSRLRKADLIDAMIQCRASEEVGRYEGN